MAFDAQGDAFAVGSRSHDGANWVVQASVRPADGGAWQAPVDLADQGQAGASVPRVAVDARGDAVAVWARSGIVQASVRSAQDGVWQTPVDLSAPGQNAGASYPEVAVDPQGDAVAVWSRSDGVGFGGNYTVQAALRPAATGVWQAPVDLSARDQLGIGGPHVALDAQGDAVAVWSLARNAHFVVQAAVLPAGGAWQAPVDLSSGDATFAQVAVDAQGDAVAVWSRLGMVEAAVRPAEGGIWQAPVNISPDGQGGEFPQLAVNARGDAVAVWHYSTGWKQWGGIVKAAVRPGGGVWQAPVALSARGRNAGAAQAAVDAQGNAVAVWRCLIGGNQIVQAAVYDASGAIAPAATTTSMCSPTPTPTPVKPMITNARQSHRVWREGNRPVTIAKATAKPPVGTTFSFDLNTPAKVRFAFTQIVAGRRVNGTCVAQTAKNRHRPACKRRVARGALSFTGHSATPNTISFQGRISAVKKLRPGRYTLVITATDAQRQRSEPKSLSFTIVNKLAARRIVIQGPGRARRGRASKIRITWPLIRIWVA